MTRTGRRSPARDFRLGRGNPDAERALINYKSLVAQEKDLLASLDRGQDVSESHIASVLGDHTAHRLTTKLKGLGRSIRGATRSAARKRPKRVEAVKPNARDGNGNGFVQDGTTAERPVTSVPLGMQSLASAPSRKRALGAEMRRRYKYAKARRSNLLAAYMKKRFGNRQPPPWEKGNLSTQEATKYFNSSDPLDQIKLQRWVMSLYVHSEIQGKKNKFRTSLDSSEGLVVDKSENKVLIRGNIEAFNPETESWEEVGAFMRELELGNKPPTVYNDVLMLGDDAFIETPFANSVKGDGFASVFNGFAFTKLRASGFSGANTDPDFDGTYVWARMGFRDADSWKAADKSMSIELQKFRDGESSIIRTDIDAELVEYLLGKSRREKDPKKKPQAADYILAVSNEEADPSSRKVRDNEIKEWFQSNIPLGAASFSFSGMNVPKDPRKA